MRVPRRLWARRAWWKRCARARRNSASASVRGGCCAPASRVPVFESERRHLSCPWTSCCCSWASLLDCARNNPQQLGKLLSYLPTPGRRFPYYIGVVGKLTSLRVMTPKTPVAGASAGSLIAACHHAGLTEKQVTPWSSSRTCSNDTVTSLGPLVEPVQSHALVLTYDHPHQSSGSHTPVKCC